MLNLKVPTIETERLILRAITIEDAPDMFDYASDEEVVKHLTFPRHQTVEDSVFAIKNFFLTRVDNGVPEAYAIIHKADNKMIGTCDIHKVSAGDICEIGYVMNRHYQNQGFVTESLIELIKVAFTSIGVRRLEIMHAVENEPSAKVIQKADFRYEGTLRQYLKNKQDGYSDLKVYSILKSEFDKGELIWQKN
jgi:ribosomal-protein-alanine N-acetyltransferase